MVTADHGRTDRGHHGGREDLQQDSRSTASAGAGPEPDRSLDQLQLAPAILTRLADPEAMKAEPFLT